MNQECFLILNILYLFKKKAHSKCYGFSCKRISTFMAIIAANHSFDVYLTATPPKQLRFRVLNADASFKAVLTMSYYTSQRIDLYMDDSFVSATNAVYSNGQMSLRDSIQNLTKFMPTANSPVGSNLYLKSDKKIHFTIDGATYIDLKLAPVLFLRFGCPAKEFYNSATVVGNMALLLGVSASQIRRVNIVKASTSASGKKKRQSDDIIYIEASIYSNPVDSLNSTSGFDLVQSQMNDLTSQIQNKYFTGELQAAAASIFNVTMTSLGVIPANVTGPDTITTLIEIAHIKVMQNAAQCHALVPCFVQPIIEIIGSDVS